MEGGVTNTEPRRPIQGFRDLEVFQRAMRLLEPVHALVMTFPDYEKYDLANQMRRAAKSIPTNIGEGYARRASIKSFRLFLTMALGSANEMEIHFEIAKELRYVSDEQCRRFIEEYQVIGRQLRTLINRWRSPSTIHPPSSSRPAAQ